MGAGWLDGRKTVSAPAEAGEHAGHACGARTLRAAVFAHDQHKQHEWLLDASTCDCCQTDAALSARGPVVVWRDRTAHELRDIQIARFAQGTWNAPRHVHRDNWHMSAWPEIGRATWRDRGCMSW